MKKDPTNGELGLMIENLTESVRTGFDGVHKRQDATNGNVTRNTEWRLKNSAAISNLLKTFYALLIAVAGLVGGAVIRLVLI